MIDMARVFASHGAKDTLIAAPSNALNFQNAVVRDQLSGRPITIHSLRLPDGAPMPDPEMSAAPFTDTSALLEPLRLLLVERPPDCIVVDAFHRWTPDVIDELGVKRVLFNGNGCFSRCVGENLRRFSPQQSVGSDSEPFLVPGLPDRVELTRSQLPSFVRPKPGFSDKMGKTEETSYGVLVNSFYELEPNYVDYFKNEMKKKAWLIGPVSLCNRNVSDKVERGQRIAIDEQICLSWLDSREPNSVLYISFGSLARLHPKQLLEIAHGLEASGNSFIWVVGKLFESANGEEEGGGVRENWLPSGFEERLKDKDRGLIIRGWAPQLLILEHRAVGGFMTHCGWNSTLEGVSAGVPMMTWPMSAEQFFNEKLITDVLRIGVQVGSKEWTSWNEEKKVLVGGESVEVAVKRLMGGGEEAAVTRKRAGELKEKAKRAVEEGGSSYAGVDALISELRSCRTED